MLTVKIEYIMSSTDNLPFMIAVAENAPTTLAVKANQTLKAATVKI